MQQPAHAGKTAPVNWLQWLYSIYSPDHFHLRAQYYGKTLTVAANRALSDNIQVPVTSWCFGIASFGWVTSSGAPPAQPYRLQIRNTSGNDWTGGQPWASGNVTGDSAVAFPSVARQWLMPRELAKDEQITFTVDNSLGAVPITVDITICTYEAIARSHAVQRKHPLEFLPTSWLEHAMSVYDPDVYCIQPQMYGATIVCAAGTNQVANTGPIQIPQSGFCMGVCSTGWKTAGGQPSFPYRVQVRNTANNDWTGGQPWAAQVVTGDTLQGVPILREWMHPRELAKDERITFGIDNTLNAADGITVDVALFMYEVRERTIERTVAR